MEILATLDDINANLDGTVVEATDANTALIQVSVARIVRGYLSRVIDAATLATWSSPDVTPEIIREVAAKLIAAQLYVNRISSTSLELEDKHFAQRLYDRAIAILNDIIDGEIPLPDVPAVESLSILDFWPNDATDRAFTMGMEL